MSEPLEPTTWSPLTFSVEGSHARTSPEPGRERVWRVKDPGCFSKWPASFAIYDPAFASWKTFQRSLLGGFQPYSGPWPLSGMMRAGEVCEHRRWAHRTAESGGSVSRGWPTMPASEGQRGHGYQRAQGRIDPTLTGATGAARAWPTPTKSSGGDRKHCGISGTTLSGAAERVMNWPTPSLTDFKGGHSPEVFDKRRERLKAKGSNGNGMGRILCAEVRRDWSSHATHAESSGAYDVKSIGSFVDARASMKGTSLTIAPHIKQITARAWPTPMAVQGNNAGSIQEWGGSSNPIRKTDPKLARGRLNPRWVEQLMGFPMDWTCIGTDGPPLQDHSTHGSHPEPDPASRTTETD